LLNPDTLVNYLPYDSIDVIFNMKNVWANHQNHHPALIKYDLPAENADYKKNDPWYPFVLPQDRKQMIHESIEIDPLGDGNVSLQKPLDSARAASLRLGIVAELEENLRLYRSKLGVDCIFEKHEYVLRELTNFLEMQELLATLDPDAMMDKNKIAVFNQEEYEKYCKKIMHYHSVNKHGSPFMTLGRYAKCQTVQKAKFAP